MQSKEVHLTRREASAIVAEALMVQGNVEDARNTIEDNIFLDEESEGLIEEILEEVEAGDRFQNLLW